MKLINDTTEDDDDEDERKVDSFKVVENVMTEKHF
jgi:hypothetical protein